LLAVGVMLDDCTSDNGPLMVVPGSHRGPIFDHHAEGHFCGAIDPGAIRDEIARAVPLTGRAGSMSFHHVRLVHGSAQNISSLPRTLLLYEYAAADAWPLMGVSDFADFNARLVIGEPSIEPRVAPVPVRMPLPPARSQGSIYENQSDASRLPGHRRARSRSAHLAACAVAHRLSACGSLPSSPPPCCRPWCGVPASPGRSEQPRGSSAWRRAGSRRCGRWTSRR